MEGSYDQKKRVRRLKKFILVTIAALIIIPIIVSVVLGVRVIRLSHKVEQLELLLSEADEVTGIFTTAVVEESSRNAVSVQQKVEMTDTTGMDTTDHQKQVYLTFDDGPSSNTNKILDVLKEYNIKATFFVVGKTDEQSVKAYQRIVEEGHTLAMHSYSHKYDEIYESKESFIADLEQLQEYLYQVTGVWPRFYRFPGGSSNTVSKTDMQELIAYLNECGITYFDWNIASGDAVSGQLDTESIINNCLSRIDNLNECVILMHDAANKGTTIEALPEIITQMKDREDVVFLPITDETIPVQHIIANQ